MTAIKIYIIKKKKKIVILIIKIIIKIYKLKIYYKAINNFLYICLKKKL